MNFLESVGGLTLIFGALYLYFNNKDKQASKQREEQERKKDMALYEPQQKNTTNLTPLQGAAPSQQKTAYDRKWNIQYIEPESKDSDGPNKTLWVEALSNDEVIPEFKILIQKFFLPYCIDFNKFFTNTEAIDMPLGYGHIKFADDPNYSKTLTKFYLNPGLMALGYPDWFYAAFPDVAMWAINGGGNKQFKDKYSGFSEADSIGPNNKKELSHTILLEVVDSYVKSGNKLECKSSL